MKEISVALSQAEDPGGNGLAHLARENGWPREAPRVARCGNGNRMRSAHREMLGSVLNDQTQLVVETGAWTGLRARAIAECAPAATVIAVDRWRWRPDSEQEANWKAMMPEVYEKFLVNCWKFRDRIIPLAASPADALRRVRAAEVIPEVICIGAEDTADLEMDVCLAHELFPSAVLLGDNWTWPRVRRAIEALVDGYCLALQVVGDMWKTWPDQTTRG